MATKWGVLSAGNICHDFVGAVRSFPEGDHQVRHCTRVLPFFNMALF